MVFFPPCKINLGLNILNKRPDGFHTIETCFYPVPWTDILEINHSEELTFSSSGNIIPGKADENLCLKAYRLMQKEFNLPPVKIHLHKIIPTGAGLGGGSSDAAHTLRKLNEIFQLNISNEKLMRYATELGSDCAFFVQDKPMLGSGRGEVLTDITINLSGKFLVLVKPGIQVSTAEAYSTVKPNQTASPLHSILTKHPLSEWKYVVKNDFEESVFEKHPEIQSIKEKLYDLGAIYASMSGSGSAVFGIFDSPINRAEYFAGLMKWSGTLE